MAEFAVVIPTVPGREEHLNRCIRSYRSSSDDADMRLYIEYNHPTCGLGWQAGAKRAVRDGFDYLNLTADDLEPHDGWLGPAVEAVDKGFIPAPLVFEPDGTLQSAGIMGWDCYTGPYEDWTAVQSTTVPFMTAEQWDAIGMIDLHYCTDMYVSYMGARAGWPTRLRTGMCFTHHNASRGRGAGMGQHPRTINDRVAFQLMMEAA